MAKATSNRIINFIKTEVVLSVFIILLLILSFFYPHDIINYPHFVDWQTIMALAGLLVITAGLKESGYFNAIAGKILKRLGNERGLAIFFVLFSTILSAFLTNDITLFIVIPLTFSIQNVIKNNLSRLIIFEAISVNVGSALTPIGNPQNLYLWHNWNISVLQFIPKMFPLVAVQLVILLIFVWILFPKKKIKISTERKEPETYKKTLLWFSLVMMLGYIIAIELKQDYIILIIVMAFYFLFYRKVLLNVDWLLLLLFIIIFIDFHILSNLPVVTRAMDSFVDLNSSGRVFLFSAFTSQFISNVPASVFISKFNHDWFAILYGVNIGGNGLVLGSLANIIALRMSDSKKIWINFHKYSIPFFLITGTVIYVLFFMVF